MNRGCTSSKCHFMGLKPQKNRRVDASKRHTTKQYSSKFNHFVENPVLNQVLILKVIYKIRLR